VDGVIGVEVVPLEHGLLELVEELAHDLGRGWCEQRGFGASQIRLWVNRDFSWRGGFDTSGADL
jgi:hypothetical protein